MKSANYDDEVLAAAAFCENSKAFDYLEHMIAQLEARRNAVLREIDRRREATARQLRSIVADVEDAEVVEDKSDALPEASKKNLRTAHPAEPADADANAKEKFLDEVMRGVV